MGDYITDSIKRKVAALSVKLLLSDSIYLASNITFENLAPLSYMGKPGNEANGGIPFQNYRNAKSSIAARKSPRCSILQNL